MENNLKEYLDKNKITQYELAKRMGNDVTPQQVQYYVGAENMSTRTIKKIAEALQVSPNKLFKL